MSSQMVNWNYCVCFSQFFFFYIICETILFLYVTWYNSSNVLQVCCYFSMKKDILLIEFQSENKRTGTVHGPHLCISEGLVPLMDQLGH